MATATRCRTPPGNLLADGGNGEVVLTWTAPTDDGGSAITGYKIEVSDDGGSTWTDLVANLDNTTYTQTGLPPGETRHYRVSAINAEGPGAPSEVASATTARPPGMPAQLERDGGQRRGDTDLGRAGGRRRVGDYRATRSRSRRTADRPGPSALPIPRP